MVENPEDHRRRRARSFGPIAGVYDRVRPSYPAEAVEWLLPADARTVVDVGAGTGALTRSLPSRPMTVMAVEPDPQMREVLSARSPGVEVREGRAESIPLADNSVDAVLGGQMWHWVDLEPAAAEVARVLRPGGTLGLVWNLRDERVEWMAELGALFTKEDLYTGPARVLLPEGAPFEDLESAEFEFTHELAPSDLVDLVASRSHAQTLPPDERAELLARVEAFTLTHPSVAGMDKVPLPYVSTCWRARRSAAR